MRSLPDIEIMGKHLAWFGGAAHYPYPYQYRHPVECGRWRICRNHGAVVIDIDQPEQHLTFGLGPLEETKKLARRYLSLNWTEGD
jgi:hypothetical protein